MRIEDLSLVNFTTQEFKEMAREADAQEVKLLQGGWNEQQIRRYGDRCKLVSGGDTDRASE